MVFDKHFPFPTDVLMTSTNGVDGKHQWCWWQALMVLVASTNGVEY
ncbi:MAG: hypothetical protein ACTTKM_06505 [Prevotella fusca]